MQNFRVIGTSALALLIYFNNSTAHAQSAGISAPTDAVTGSDGEAAGEITVTARRRDERAQDVPISVSALSAETLTTRGIRNALDLQNQTPSLSLSSNNGSAQALSYSLRGQVASEIQLLTDSPVGTYFAEVVQPRPYGFGNALYDIQNVQVLKGVQGTLFGRNMTGGAVLIEPAHPQFDRIGGSVTAQLGSFSLRDITAVLNVPVADWLALRVAGKHRERNGFTRDISTGRDYDDQNFDTFRASAEIRAGRITSYTVFDYLRQREHGSGSKLNAFSFVDPINGDPTVISFQAEAAPFFPVAAGAPSEDLPTILARDLSLGKYRVNYGNVGTGPLAGLSGAPFLHILNYGVVNKTIFDAGSVQFKNIFGYRRVKFTNQTDFDGSSANLIYAQTRTRTKNFSEEFQLQGKPLGDRLNLTIGGYYFRESGTDGSVSSQFAQLSSIGTASGSPELEDYYLNQPASFYLASGISSGVASSYAFYAEGTYSLSDKVKITAGLRYNNDERRAAVNPTSPNFVIPLAGGGTVRGLCDYIPGVNDASSPFGIDDCRQTRTLKNEALTYQATIQYMPTNDIDAYAAFRHGYRAGGFSLRASNDATFTPFQPEKVDEYEVGMKNMFNLGSARLSTSLAAFYQNYSNVQVQTSLIIDNSVQTVITNFGVLHDYGGEFEASLQMRNGLSANIFYAYVQKKVIRGDNGSFPMAGVPHHQLGGGITFDHEYDFGRASANLNAVYRSRTPLDDYDRTFIQKGYALVNGRIGVDGLFGTGLGLAAFVNNLFDKYYLLGGASIVSGGPATGGVGFGAGNYGEPRTVGVEASYRF